MSTASGPQSLETRAVRGFLWNYGGFVGGRALVLVSTLVLARLLEPEDFGLVAFALALLAYLDNVTSHGVGESLVYRPDADDSRVASTAWWLALATAIPASAAVWLAAPALADHASDPGTATWILRVLGLQLVVGALASTHHYLLRRALDFRRLFVAEQAGGAVKGGLAIVLALQGAGVWSLVAGQLAGVATAAAALWLVSRFRPAFTLLRAELRPLLRVGWSFAAVAVLGEAVRNVDYLIVGWRAGAAELGYYFMAFRLPELVVFAIFAAAWNVLFPYYARVREEDALGGGARLVPRYLQTMRLGALVALPLGAAMAALAVPIVLVLFGERWRPSADPLALIALWAGLAAVSGMPGSMLKSLGRPQLLLVNNLAYLAVLVPCLWVTASVSITAVAAAHLAVQAVFFVSQAVLAGRVLAIGWGAAVVGILPAAVVAAGVGGALYGLAQLLEPVPALIVGVPASFACYAVLVRLLAPGDAAAVLRAVRGLLGRGPAADGDVITG